MAGIEDKTHLFIQCNWTRSIWRNIFAQHGIWHSLRGQTDELQQLIEATKGQRQGGKAPQDIFPNDYIIYLDRAQMWTIQYKSTDNHIILAKGRKIIRDRTSLY